VNFATYNIQSDQKVNIYYYYLIIEKMYLLFNNQKQHFTFVGMAHLPALLPNAAPRRFFAKMSKTRQF
jgi:hypothetical protein